MTAKTPANKAKKRYDRIAWMYDAMEGVVERLALRRWRQRLWSRVPAGRGLEVGVGTGKNIPHYPRDADITAIEMSPKMLERARRRACRLSSDVQLLEMNAEHLDFANDSFDWAVATFVFCSVADPVQGLRELGRVVKPGGEIYLLEHVRIERPLLGKLMDMGNLLTVRLTGANINRPTVGNVVSAGLRLERVEDLGPLGVAKLILARSGGAESR